VRRSKPILLLRRAMDALLFPRCLLGAADLRAGVFKLIIKPCIIVGSPHRAYTYRERKFLVAIFPPRPSERASYREFAADWLLPHRLRGEILWTRSVAYLCDGETSPHNKHNERRSIISPLRTRGQMKDQLCILHTFVFFYK
jgi:hypothetical protein